MQRWLALILLSSCTSPRLLPFRTTFPLLEDVTLTGFTLDLVCDGESTTLTGPITIDGNAYVVEARTGVCFDKETQLSIILNNGEIRAVRGKASGTLGREALDITFDAERVGELAITGTGSCDVAGEVVTLPASVVLPIGDITLSCESDGVSVQVTATIATGNRQEVDVKAPTMPGAPARLVVNAPPTSSIAGVSLKIGRAHV